MDYSKKETLKNLQHRVWLSFNVPETGGNRGKEVKYLFCAKPKPGKCNLAQPSWLYVIEFDQIRLFAKIWVEMYDS